MTMNALQFIGIVLGAFYIIFGFFNAFYILDPDVQVNKFWCFFIIWFGWLPMIIFMPKWWTSLYDEKYDNNWWVTTFIRA